MKELNTLKKMVERNLQSYAEPKKGHPVKIYSAMKYSLMAGGKRLRPILLLLTAKACGKSYSDVMPAACAVEMIHTYSLIHDDLPGMDNDDLRRGKLTCHKKYDEATAILAGDGLLTRAFELIVMNGSKKGIKSANAMMAALEIAKNAGAEGMVGGQVADMMYESKKPDKQSLEYIHKHKTGALITASVTAGALLAGASKQDVNNFRKFGEKIGLTFQVVDDILDITADEKKLGKTKGKDQASNKMTYPSLYGLEASKKKASKLVLEAKQYLGKINKNTNKLELIADYFTARTY